MTTINMRNISKNFAGVKAVDQVDLVIESGCLHALIGENGAGKSTLMKILAGRYQTDKGQVFLDGKPVRFANPSDALRSGIGMLYQEPTDFPFMNVLDSTKVGFSLRGRKTSRQIGGEIERLVSQHGFQLSPDMRVENLSLGQRQQLELLWLLLQDLPVLIFDEPTTGGITLEQQQTLFRTLRRLSGEGRTVIFISHNLKEVMALADLVTVMRRGKVVTSFDPPFAEKILIEAMFGQDLSLSNGGKEVILGSVIVSAQTSALAFKLQEGETVGLAGLEGSGQRQLLRDLTGLGDGFWNVFLGEQRIRNFSDAESRGVFFLPASRLEEGLIPGLTLAEHVLLSRFRDTGWIPWKDVYQAAQEGVERYSIQTPSVMLPVEHLSGGNQQRLLLAMIPDNTKVLVLESPTRGLDYASANQFWGELRQRRQKGTAIIFSSPDIDELWQESDRVLVFFAGRVIGEIDPRKEEKEHLRRMIGGLA